MAPSNLNQVFVVNAALPASGGVFNTVDGTAAYSSLAASANRGGVWTRPFTTGTPAYVNTALFTASSGAVSQTVEYFQMVQGTTKAQPIATPIIPIKDVRRVKATVGTATVRHAQVWTFGAALPAAVAGVNGSVMVKCDIRVAPTFYEMFANPANANLDLSGGGYTFPILGNFAAGRTMIPIVEIAPGTSAVNAALAVQTAITSNTLLNAIFIVTLSSGQVTVTARHPGTIFDIAVFDTVSKVSSTNFTAAIGGAAAPITTTGFNAGTGNYWQVISEEKAQRGRYGYLNRMYFPFEQTTYAQFGTQYSVIEVSYEHSWPHSTGIARAGELNNFKIYMPATGLTTANYYGTIFTGGVAAAEANF